MARKQIDLLIPIFCMAVTFIINGADFLFNARLRKQWSNEKLGKSSYEAKRLPVQCRVERPSIDVKVVDRVTVWGICICRFQIGGHMLSTF